MAESTVPRVYVELARRFVDQLIEPNTFMMRILDTYKAETGFFEGETLAALDALFYAAEEFVDEPSHGPGAIDEVQLRTAARDFLQFAEAQSQK